MSAPIELGAQGAQSTTAALARASEPAFVREGSAALKSAYQEGVGFEEMLMEELTHSLAATTGIGSSEGEGGEANAGVGGGEEEGGAGGASEGAMLSSLVPRALSEGVVAGGGLGLASQLAREIAPGGSAAASTPASRSTGGAGS